MPALIINRLDYHISKNQIFRDLNLEIGRGELVAILGQSGTGKSTLLKLIAQIFKPSAGTIKSDASLFYMPQEASLMPWRNVLENVLFPIEIERQPRIKDHQIANYYLNQMELSEDKYTASPSLSAGMRQRALIAQAMISPINIHMYDEPLSAIDLAQKARVIPLLRKHLKDNNKTLIVVTHSIDEALCLCDRIFVLNKNSLTPIPYRMEEAFRDLRSIASSPNYGHLNRQCWEAIEKR